MFQKNLRYKAFIDEGGMHVVKYKYSHKSWKDTNECFCINNNMEVSGTTFSLDKMQPLDEDIFSVLGLFNEDICGIIHGCNRKFDNFIRFLQYEKPEKPRQSKSESANYCMIQGYENENRKDIIGVFRIFSVKDKTISEKARFGIKKEIGRYNPEDLIEHEIDYDDELSCLVERMKKGHENEFYFRNLEKIIFVDWDFIENTRMKYLEENVKEAVANNRMAFRLFIMANDYLYEKLYKSGYGNIKYALDKALNGSIFAFSTPHEVLSFIFSTKKPETEGELHKCLKIPSHALRIMNSVFALDTDGPPNYKALSIFRKVINNEKLFFSMDQDSFSQILATIYKTSAFKNRNSENFALKAMQLLTQIYGWDGCVQYFEYISWFVSDWEDDSGQFIVPYHDFRSTNLKQMYIDYLKMALACDIRVQWKIEDLSHLQELHDGMVEVMNERKNRDKEEAFEGVKDSMLPYEYEGKDFCICVPKKAEEIAEEGKKLHHCVASYIDDVIARSTIILFIRKKEEPDKPFFTLEIKNKSVRQCHGFANCCISSQEGLQEFLEEYCKEKDIYFNEKKADMALPCGT